MNAMKLALGLYALLAAGLLVLAAWLIASIVANGVDVDMVAFLTVIFMAFRDVISKMGETVRGLTGEPIAAPATDAEPGL